MKKSIHHLLVTSLLILGTVFIISCSNGSSSDSDSKSKRIYLASSYSGLSDYMKKTLSTTGLATFDKTSGIPEVFVVRGSDLASMTEENMRLAVETCAEGNTFIIDSPTQAQVKAFKAKLDTFLEKEGNEYQNALQDVHQYSIDNLLLQFEYEEAVEGDFEAAGMRKTQVYFVHDIDEVYAAEEVGSEAAEEDVDCPETNPAPIESEPKDDESINDVMNDYTILIEESSENFADWIKLINSVEPVTQGRAELDNAKQAQSIVHNFTATFSSDRDHYDGRYNGKSENVQVFIDVWTACDIDNKTDYYLVRTSCVCNNQQLGYKNEWDSAKYVGPYLDYANVTTKIEKAELKSSDCSPQTGTGSTSFGTSEGFNIGGNVGFNASGPTGGISTGYSHTESTTRSIPDIQINLETGSNTATWKYTTPEVKGVWSGFVTKCDGAKNIQYNTAMFDTYALYKMTSDLYYYQENVPLVTTAEVNLKMVTGWLTGIFNQTLHNGWGGHWTRRNWIDYVRKPSNSFRNYIMAFEPPSEMTIHEREILANALQVYIPDWGNSVRYYGIINVNKPENKANIDKIAKSHFEIAKKTIENNKKVLKDRGFSGNFKFYMKAADGEGELTSFSLTF